MTLLWSASGSASCKSGPCRIARASDKNYVWGYKVCSPKKSSLLLALLFSRKVSEYAARFQINWEWQLWFICLSDFGPPNAAPLPKVRVRCSLCTPSQEPWVQLYIRDKISGGVVKNLQKHEINCWLCRSETCRKWSLMKSLKKLTIFYIMIL